MNIRQWIFSSLRSKLLFIFIILMATPLIFVGIVSYIKSYNTIAEHAVASAVLEAERLKREIDTIIQDTVRFSEITKLDSVIHFLSSNDETYEEAKSILNTLSIYRNTYKLSSNISDVHMMNEYGKAISENKGVYFIEDALPYHFEGSGPQIILTPGPYSPGNVRVSVSIVHTITWDITNEIIGIIVIDLDPMIIEQTIQQASLGTTGSFYIQNDYGSIIFPSSLYAQPSKLKSDLLVDSEGYFTYASQASNQFIVFNTLDISGWKVVGEVPYSEIMKQANDIRSLILISAAASILFAITLYYFLSARLIRPIRHLKETMRLAARGDLDVKVINEGTDEIADLGVSFNIMLKKIKMLLAKSIEEQEQLKKAELRTMQEQINPHFLYNTLDTIVWMAEAKKSKGVIDMTKALSHFFRLTLSKGKDRVSLKDEIEHIRNYLMIQKIRYRDILDFEFSINEHILQHTILKLSLQPLVENAIYHGIKNKRGQGLIQIIGDFDHAGHIVIQIIDDGVGMSPDKLADLQAKLNVEDGPSTELDEQEGGFGLSNVHQRIRLNYGERFGLSINSWYGAGTHVTLTIPAER